MSHPANTDKRINYCFLDEEGMARVVVVIKWEKGNLYIMDIGQPWKVSYHAPRNGKSQVHLKISDSAPYMPSQEVPIEDIKGYRMLNGAGMELDRLNELPVAKEGAENYILDTRPYHHGPLSKVQWDHYLVEPGNEEGLHQLFKKHEESSTGMSEEIALHKITTSIPWIITRFTRIRDEDPRWYE